MSRVKKFGDVHVVMGEEAQEEAFARLFNVRREVQRQKGFDWGGFWPLDAQKDCQKMLRERWQASDELPRDRVDRANRKQTDSWYHVWCYQQFGGEGWVKIFFAFGVVDADAVKIYNEEWAKILRSKGYEPTSGPHPNPRLSVRGRAKARGEPLPDIAGPKTHKSEHKKCQDLLRKTGTEIVAYRQAQAGKGRGTAGAPAASRGQGKGKGKSWGVPSGQLESDGKWKVWGRSHTMLDLETMQQDRAHSHFILNLIVTTSRHVSLHLITTCSGYEGSTSHII